MKYFMSVGSDCSIALYLRDINLRQVAFPFDWCVISIPSVIKLIESDFKDFLDEDNLVFMSPANRKMVDGSHEDSSLVDDIITPCYDKKYRMLLPHDFSENGKGDLSQVLEKYTRRITRLIELLHDSDNSFVFIANDAPTPPTSWRAQRFEEASGESFINDNKEWKHELSRMLNNKYPTLKYELHNLNEFKRVNGK